MLRPGEPARFTLGPTLPGEPAFTIKEPYDIVALNGFQLPNSS